MRLVVQRVTRASVSAGSELLGRIEAGALVLAGVGHDDTPEVVDRMADKLIGLRYFEDAEGRTNLAIGDPGGSLLVVSQFTLYAETRKGNRPSFTAAAAPDVAEPLYEIVCSELGAERGKFGAKMEVALVNDGPLTLIIEVDPGA